MFTLTYLVFKKVSFLQKIDWKVLMFFLIGTTLLDALSTISFMRLDGVIEANPIFHFLFKKFGVIETLKMAIPLYLSLMTILGFVYENRKDGNGFFIRWFIFGSGCMHALAFLNNYSILLRS